MRRCTLGPKDLAALASKRADHNRLGYALLLSAMCHPGRVLDVGKVPPASMVAYVARQIGTHPAALRSYPARVQTRREQIADLMRHHGFGAFGRAEAARFLSWLTPIEQLNRKASHLVSMLVEEVRRQRVLLPAPRVTFHGSR